MDKLVSIIVPVYNVEEYIEKCIVSILNQTYKHLELILIDDGSKDKSSDICRCYAKKDERIIILTQKNSGVSAARNHGLQYATGEFVTFVDSDDYIRADYIERLLNEADDDVDVVCCNIPSALKNMYGVISNTADIAYVFTEFGYAWGKLIRKDCIDVTFPIEVWYAEDFVFYISIMKNIRKIVVSQYEGYYYRIRRGSLSVKDKTEEHSLKEFKNKYTFVKGFQNLEKVMDMYDIQTKSIIQNHCYYIFLAILLLMYRLQDSGYVIEKKYVSFIRKQMITFYSVFFKITLVQRRNMKRFLFGTVLLISPKIGGSITNKLLE